MDAAGAGDVGGEVFVYGDMNIGGAGGVDVAILGDEVIAFYIACTGGLEGGCSRDGAGDMSVGGAALVHLEIFDVDGAAEIAGATEGHIEIIAGYDPVDEDIAGAGRLETVQQGIRYIGL